MTSVHSNDLPTNSLPTNNLPNKLKQGFESLLNTKPFVDHIAKTDYQALLDHSGLDATQCKLALLDIAAQNAHPPLSNFNVGAIAEGLSGDLYFGANIEFLGVGLNQSVHAEQSAISHAWMKGEKGIAHITINYAPCGHCRQFMNELSTAKDLKIQLPNHSEKTLHEFLPFDFSPSDLDVSQRLMDGYSSQYSLDGCPLKLSADVALQKAALDALNHSHAPYTKHQSGVALRLENGEIIAGRYAENAAFNPSLPPLQVALNLLLLSGYQFEQITHACLIELESPISHSPDTSALLTLVAPTVELDYLKLTCD